VEITDTGSGISQQNLNRVRDPFFTTKSPAEGSGLGLAVSDNILRAFGGEMIIQSTLGKGTTILVVLPIATPDNVDTPIFSPPRRSSPPENLPKNSRLRVLIIDDDPLVARVLNRILREHHVSVCVDGSQARNILKDDTMWDLILCDLMMPNVTGMDIHQFCVEQCPENVQQMVFITGGTFTRSAQDFIDDPKIKVLHKPIQVQQLTQLVDKVIHKSDPGVTLR
jgi:CheY-like chemotaxis protein